jgi:hypothetical protein
VEEPLEHPLLTDRQQASKLEAELAEILAPLEAAAGTRLKGWGRRKWLSALAENPAGFRSCACEALERGRNPLGLLVQMVKDGDHDVETLPSAAPQRGHGVCFACGCEVDDAFFLSGEWWCSEHEGLASAA